MTSLASYSPLEELLLFQALRHSADAAFSFSTISTELKRIPLVRNDPSYDPSRLDPHALQQLYLGLLKEEVRQDLERQEEGGRNRLPNGSVSPASRKRKIASPKLPTVEEASKHNHLIPQLVARLYTRYRDNVVAKLREYEQTHAGVVREIGEIEAGEWDERLQAEEAQSQSQPRASKPSSIARAQSTSAEDGKAQSRPPSATATPNATPKLVEPPRKYSQATIDAVMNHGPEPQDKSSSHFRASSNTTLPPLSEMATQSPRFGIAPSIPASTSNQQPIAPQPYSQTPPQGHQSPYGSHSLPRPGSMPSPQIQQPLSRPSSSHRPILPPPPGMQLQIGSPVSHVGSPGMHPQPPLAPQPQYAQHQRMAPGTPPTSEYPARAYPSTHAPQQPQHAAYHPQQPYTDQRPPYPVPHSQHQQPAPYPQPHTQPSRGGYMLPPFQVAPQDHHKPIQPRQHRTPIQPQPQLGAYLPHGHGGPSTAPRGPPLRTSRAVSDVLSALATPPRQKVRPLWKSEYRPSPLLPVQASTPRPDIEPLSPTEGRSKSPSHSARSKRGRDGHAAEQPQTEAASKARTSKRRANARAGSPHSVVSSTADESFRSHSVSTATGVNIISDDRPGSRDGVKAEPSTPGNILEDTEPATAPSGISAAGPMTRKRRGTVNSRPQPSHKRKRHESPSANAHEQEPTGSPVRKGNTIFATRNFAKMSSAIMNDINSHKHAAYFATAVREKAAPGYSDIVLWPQNLKSIRTAITAGTKAVAAATSALDSPADLDGSNTIELERTPDLEPPKAIVNGEQLEKELMRMLANAYMFNPGEDGMALSTREFFDDIEQKISDWRGTERRIEDDEGKGKRRKV